MLRRSSLNAVFKRETGAVFDERRVPDGVGAVNLNVFEGHIKQHKTRGCDPIRNAFPPFPFFESLKRVDVAEAKWAPAMPFSAMRLTPLILHASASP